MRLFPTRSLAAKLTLGLVGACLAVFLLMLVDVHHWTREMLLVHIRREGEALIDGAAAKIDGELLRVEEAPRRLAHALEEGLPSPAALQRDLCANVAGGGKTVFGSAAAFEPGVFEGLGAYSPYCYREGGGLRLKDLAAGGYDYPRRDWYRLPRERGAPLWSEPYFDEGGGGILMATYSVPIRDARGARTLGIATADVALEWLQVLLQGIKVGRTGYAFLVSHAGNIVTHPDPRLAMKANLAALAADRNEPGLRRLAESMLAGRSGLERTQSLTGDASFVVFRPLAASGWNLAVVFPESETLADVAALQRRLCLTGLVGAALIAVVVVLVSRRITRPLAQLTRAAQDVAGGRLDTPLPPAVSQDEIGRLTASFAEMQTALTQYVETVKESAAAEERLESELRVARQIQMSLLPKPADLSSDRLGCDVFGLLDPARAVGGDLYDVVLRRPGEVCFVIGDVSDKGIPAALFMAMTDIHFEAAARELRDPEAVLARINDALVVENMANMFVTLACGVLDTRSGRLSLASGGHTRSVLLPAGAPPRFLEGEPGTVLGIVAGLAFRRHELLLEPGDSLVLYTDGVTEAHDSRRELFGEERLLAHLSARPDRDPRSVADGIRDAVRSFAGEAPQFDDIAILVVRRAAGPALVPASSEARLEIEGRLEELPRCREWMGSWCAGRGIGEAASQDLDLALDEVLSNVIQHGYGARTVGAITLRLSLAGDAVRLQVSDRAPAFDPTDAPAPGTASADGRGGLGMHLVRRLMDRVEYVRENGENRLVLERRRGFRPVKGADPCP